jgi:hypothetical protein
MALRGEVVDLVGLGLLDDADQVGAVRQIAIVQYIVAIIDMRILIEMLDAPRIERR